MKHVLIVDDEITNLNRAKEILGAEYTTPLSNAIEQLLNLYNTSHNLNAIAYNRSGIKEFEFSRELPDEKKDLSENGTFALLEEYYKNLELIINEKTILIEKMQDAIISSLTEMVEVRDGETGGHVQRVSGYLEILAVEMEKEGVYKEQLTPGYIKQLIRTAALHDIGKIGISDSTLLKTSSLDEKEREYMKMHTTLGAKAIKKAIEKIGSEKFLYEAYDMALSHHEWWNGKGYPEGLSGTEIPLCARIIAIADVYDALTSERPYHKKLPHEDAVKIILNGSGTQFEPCIAEVFEHIHDKFKSASIIYHDKDLSIK